MGDGFEAADGVDEFLFDAPAAGFGFGDGDEFVAAVGAEEAEFFAGEVEAEGAGGAVEDVVAGGGGGAGDLAAAHVEGGAGFEIGEDLEVVGDVDGVGGAVGIAAGFGVDACGGLEREGDVSGPAGHGFVGDAEAHGVEAAEGAVVAPGEGAVGVEEAAAGEGVDVEEGADGVFGEEAAEGGVPAEGEGAGDDHGGEFGAGEGGVEHAAGLGGVHGHAGLAEDVFVGGEGGEGDGGVEAGPGADDDGVEVGIGDEVFPAGGGVGDVEFVGDALAAFGGAVADLEDFDAGDGLEEGDMFVAGVAAGADDTDADGGRVHGSDSEVAELLADAVDDLGEGGVAGLEVADGALEALDGGFEEVGVLVGAEGFAGAGFGEGGDAFGFFDAVAAEGVDFGAEVFEEGFEGGAVLVGEGFGGGEAEFDFLEGVVDHGMRMPELGGSSSLIRECFETKGRGGGDDLRMLRRSADVLKREGRGRAGEEKEKGRGREGVSREWLCRPANVVKRKGLPRGDAGGYEGGCSAGPPYAGSVNLEGES